MWSDGTEASLADTCSDDARYNTADLGFNEEWSTDKAIVGSDKFHHIDFFTTREDGHADSIEDDEDRDDKEDD